ncbi:MAG: hypothetical protein B6D37_15640 [Sphingobacteriales bacterium UTBCD1]|jgi:hypothetical protein|nr:MAG: hypothetical protein B6D37_15640 [Sphingobacteriales bacterium UTBCD1]
MAPFSVPDSPRITHRKLLFILLAFTLIFSAQAQEKKFFLKEYSFDKYGFKIPFYSRAELNKTNVGKSNELVEYSFIYSTKYEYLGAKLRIYPNAGCQRVDSFYASVERYAKAMDSVPDAFGVYMSGSYTGPFGWTYYRLSGGDNYQKYRRDYRYSRDILAATNGKIIFIADIIVSKLDENKNVKQILDEPGFSSLPLPVTLDKYKLKMDIKGNVGVEYNNEDKAYWIGRCDKLGSVYPFAKLVKTGAPVPESEINKYLASLKNDNKKTKIEYADISKDTLLKNINGKISRISYQEKINYNDEKAETQTQVVLYFFTINGIGYKTELYVPFVKNDNIRILDKEVNNIDEKSVPGFESRLREFIGTLRK